MSPAFWIGLIIVIPVVGFVLWLLFVDAAVLIEPGTIGLLLRRGKATERALPPGRHFVVPFRKLMVQTYPSRELSYVAGGDPPSDAATEVTMLDSPLRLHLGDRASVSLSYTLRCRLILAEVKQIHDRFGPDGIWSIIRDESRRTLIAEGSSNDVRIGDVLGAGFVDLDRRFGAAVSASLGAIGFEVTMFNLREIDLGRTGEVIQGTVRADAELERERARATLRRARIEGDVELASVVDELSNTVLRYRTIETWDDLVHRWDGGNVPAVLTTKLATETAALVEEPAATTAEPAADEPTAPT